jgi:hypothetical protein
MPTTGETSGHRPQTAWRRLAATLLTLLFLTGCTPPADRAADARTSAAGDPAPPTTTPRDGTIDPPTASPVDCGADLAALDAVISEQLAAFAHDDWDRAFALTSRQFRASGVDADRLREIVTAGYAEAADAERHEVLGCVRTGPEAQVLIEVTATDGATLGLVYLMTREDGRWRISGAVEHGTGASEPTTIPA